MLPNECFQAIVHNFSTCHSMADDEHGDEVGGHPHSWEEKMKTEMKARLEKRKRHHSCGDVAPETTKNAELEKRRRHSSAGRVGAELPGAGGDVPGDGELHQQLRQLEVEPPPAKTKKPRNKELEEIARRVG